MINLLNKTNSIMLYHYFENNGYKGTKLEFDEKLFNKNLFSFERTYVFESEGQVTGFIQYGKTKDSKGIIRLFNASKEEDGKELLFRALIYFYMFHLQDIIVLDDKYSIDETTKLGMEFNSVVLNLFSSFNLSKSESTEIPSFRFIKA